MANTLLRDKAQRLRAAGKSFNELTELLKIPKSTIRYWCRDIILSEKQQRLLYQKQKLGGILAAEKIRRKRIALTNQLLAEGRREIGKISKRDLWVAGTALYWAEGYRKGNEEFGFTNSDPRMIQLMIKWLEEICAIPRERIYLRVCINFDHANRIETIHKFWSQVTDISQKQFTRPTLIRVKNRKRYLESENYFGTLRVKVRKSTNFQRKIRGWIEGLAKN